MGEWAASTAWTVIYRLFVPARSVVLLFTLYSMILEFLDDAKLCLWMYLKEGR
jgi:hypothetical protein